MDRERFNTLLKDAGFESKKELAIALNLPYGSVNNWGKHYPAWVESVLLAFKKANLYDKALAESGSLEALQLENARLKAECQKLYALKVALANVLEIDSSSLH